MKTETKTIPAIDYVEITYNEPGETDGTYTVGDVVRTYWRNGGGTSGEIIEIFISEHRNVYQVKVKNGWCTHPNDGDTIEIIKKYQHVPSL